MNKRYHINKQCLYKNKSEREECCRTRWKEAPFCKNHFVYLTNIIDPEEQRGGGSLSGLTAVLGKASGALGKAGQFASKGLKGVEAASSKVGSVLSTVDTVTSKVDAATGKVGTIFDRADDMTSKITGVAGRGLNILDNSTEQLTGQALSTVNDTSDRVRLLSQLLSSSDEEQSIAASDSGSSNIIRSMGTSPYDVTASVSPNFQSQGDYFCIKKSFVNDLRVLFNTVFNDKVDL